MCLSGAGLGYSEGEIHELITKYPEAVTLSTENIEGKHPAWGRQLGVTAGKIRDMIVKQPTLLGMDPEGDLMRLKVRFHSEVRCSTRLNLPACCPANDVTRCIIPEDIVCLSGLQSAICACTPFVGERAGEGRGSHNYHHDAPL